jgi:acyl-coenzyme A synthetase/AMP-(fatty) acid ligase
MPEILALVLALAVIGAVVLLLSQGLSGLTDRRDQRALATARWDAAHYSRGGQTHVVVRLLPPLADRWLDEREVAVIPDTAEDYDRRFVDAMQTARERAAILNQT